MIKWCIPQKNAKLSNNVKVLVDDTYQGLEGTILPRNNILIDVVVLTLVCISVLFDKKKFLYNEIDKSI